MKKYSGEALNVLHTIGLDKLYPIVRCRIDVAGHLDKTRLENALTGVTQVIPQILCRYEMQDNSWIKVENDVKALIRNDVKEPDEDAKSMDLMKEPQLRIYWNKQTDKEQLIIYISHILTDGAGCKQLLYLLAKAYNDGPESITKYVNLQDIEWLQKLVAETKLDSKKASDHPDKPLALPPLQESDNSSKQLCGSLTLDAALTGLLIKKSHENNVTLNDIFMAVFGKTIQRVTQNDSLSMACPTDMRQFITETPAKTVRIANHTSRYNINVHADLNESVAKTVQTVHAAMSEVKARKQCFESIAGLLRNYDRYTLHQLQKIVEENYHVRPIAYTNFGILDSNQFQFKGVEVTNAVLTGGFRLAPMFQIAVSTFQNKITLAFNMKGSRDDFRAGMALTQTMADLLTLFVTDEAQMSVDLAVNNVD